MKFKIVLKIILFTAGFMLIYNLLTLFLIPKTFEIPGVNDLADKNCFYTLNRGFYNEKRNSLDVVFLGSSQLFFGVNPNVIWNQNGITSYDFGRPWQDLGTSYYFLKQVFETQSPKVAVIDIYLNGSQRLDDINDYASHRNFDLMKHDFYRTEAIFNRTKRLRFETFFPVMTFHTRWEELNQNDIMINLTPHDFLKGSFIAMVSKPKDSGTRIDWSSISSEKINRETAYWIESIRTLCEKNNCECLFVKIPFLYDIQPVISSIQATASYLQENNIPFINLNELDDTIGLDYDKDLFDAQHINWYGQLKVSSWLGKYLQNNYQIENKKGLRGYEQWDEDYEKMMYYVDKYLDLYNEAYD